MSEELNILLKAYEDYKSGYYESKELYSPEDLKGAIQRKQIFVFPGKVGTGGYVLLIFGVFLVIIGLISLFSIININSNTNSYLPTWIPFIPLGLAVFVLILGSLDRHLRKNLFIAVGPSGVVYKLWTGGVQGFTWDYIEDMPFIQVTEFYRGIKHEWKEVHFQYTNGKTIHFKPKNYILDEFSTTRWEEMFCSIFYIYWKLAIRNSVD